jgi:hypothetical protein
VIESREEQGRDLSRLVVSRAGRLVATGDDREPYRVIGPDGVVAEPVSVFLRDLLASGKSAATLRSYAVDLLRWWRFLDAAGVEWDRASRAEARDFSCWIQLTVKQRLQTSRPRAARWSSRAPVLRLSPGRRQRTGAEPVPAGCLPPGPARARAPQPDG